jgi:hypothetical protein
MRSNEERERVRLKREGLEKTISLLGVSRSEFGAIFELVSNLTAAAGGIRNWFTLGYDTWVIHVTLSLYSVLPPIMPF